MAQLGNLYIPSYSNSLFDFYKRVPHALRFDARILRQALKQADPYLYNTISANHGYPAGWSSFKRALVHTSYGQVKKLFAQNRFERTWLPAEEVLKNQLRSDVEKIRNGPLLDIYSQLDSDKFIEFIDMWLDGKIKANQTLLLLLTLNSYLEQMEQ